MKAAVWYNNRDIRIEEVPTPSPGTGEMLVKVHSCGICGSDIVEWYRLPRAPLVQGHEIGVEVVATGTGVNRFKIGDRLFIAPKIPCMKCRYCLNGHYPQCTSAKDRLPGGFAEYILVPGEIVAGGCYPLPENISYDQATFIEPLACVIRAQRLAGAEPDQNMLVLGAGMSGLLHIKLAKYKACTVSATDIRPERRKLAEQFGAGHTFSAEADVANELIRTTGRKADVVVVTTGAPPALEQAWQSVDMGGAVVLFAVPGPEKTVTVPVNDFWRKEIRILTSYYCGPDDIETAIGLIKEKKITVDELITHRLPLEETVKGFNLLLGGDKSLKVIIKPHQKNKMKDQRLSR